MTKASLLELLKASRSKRRFREQAGSVVQRSDGFYIRYYKDSDGVRTKVTERLCDLNTHPKKIKLLQRSFMSGINLSHREVLHSPTEAPAVTVGGFWVATYWPWVQANKRWSTARGYEYVWKIYVKPELETTRLDTYTTASACALLDYMATTKKLNANTLASVKSLCRGIFTMATRKDIIKNQPLA
jgi:hypothetical protein